MFDQPVVQDVSERRAEQRQDQERAGGQRRRTQREWIIEGKTERKHDKRRSRQLSGRRHDVRNTAQILVRDQSGESVTRRRDDDCELTPKLDLNTLAQLRHEQDDDAHKTHRHPGRFHRRQPFVLRPEMRKHDREQRHRRREDRSQSAGDVCLTPGDRGVRDHAIEDAHRDERQPGAPRARDRFPAQRQHDEQSDGRDQRPAFDEGERRYFRAAHLDEHVRRPPDRA